MAEEKKMPSGTNSVLVVGGGISGLTAAVEAAEVGYEVFIVEKNPYLGGRVAQMTKYFPKLCPPYCGLEINFRRIKDNNRIRFFTCAEVENVSGQRGDYNVTIRLNPRYVNENCTSCGECIKVCPVERDNDFNFGMDKSKAIYLPHEMAFPMRYVIDMDACLGEECGKCVAACKYDAIELGMASSTFDLKVASIIWATGWEPYDATKIDNLGFGQYPNIITNMMMERLASVNGPTQGKILRPSDNKEISSIAFVQCAGSRDENHLPYCSYICCMASLKQATYVREQYPDAEIYVFYIDLRTPGRYEKFLNNVQADEKVFFIKGKVAKVTEDPETGNITVEAEDAVSGRKVQKEVEMVVLATGMAPSAANMALPDEIKVDESGFIVNGLKDGGMFAVGCAKKPVDVVSCVEDSTGAALKAIQTMVRR